MRRTPRWLHGSLVLSLAGLAVAGYLTVVAYDEALLVCGLGDCATVQNSPYAKFAGVPIALLGASMYGVLVLVSLIRLRWFRVASLNTSSSQVTRRQELPIPPVSTAPQVTSSKSRLGRWALPLTTAAFTVALVGTLYSAYLTYLELFVIHAICQWCVASAVLITGTALLEGWGLWRLLEPTSPASSPFAGPRTAISEHPSGEFLSKP